MFLNVTENDTCPYCLDDAQVLVEVVAESDQYGPCPFCERGKLLEFPPPRKDGSECVGRWGKQGYWRGRSTDFLKPVSNGQAPPPAQVRELLTTSGWLKEMP